MENTIRFLALAGIVIAISACDSIGGSGAVEMAPEADAYEYKGAVDPLTSIPGTERAGDLAARFDRVQGRQ